MTKEERRRSKGDAWVDILVASHSRHAGNQDAELHRPGGPRPRNASRPDPKAARAEVAQVLAAIRAPSSQFDGDSVDIEPMNVPHCSKIDSSGSHLDISICADDTQHSRHGGVRGSAGRRSAACLAADGLF
jgi:hypothetical protein